MTDRGDVEHLVRVLRQLMTTCDSASYLIGGSLESIDPALDATVAQVRPTLNLAADQVTALLRRVERTDAYIEQRTRALARREGIDET